MNMIPLYLTSVRGNNQLRKDLWYDSKSRL